mmetsp:Transcript_22466/g.58592  ORF Transcript_22466/g.58592 Transcript_22466/m.58592 type:complete len:94 (+) Transcript_22466:1-282(+)
MAQAMEPQHYLYGTGDADGSAYLTSGTFPDWLHYAFDSLAYTVELPPESWDMGNFLLDGQLILGAARSAYKVCPHTHSMRVSGHSSWGPSHPD